MVMCECLALYWRIYDQRIIVVIHLCVVYDSGYEFFFHGFLTVLVVVNIVAIKCGLVFFLW